MDLTAVRRNSSRDSHSKNGIVLPLIPLISARYYYVLSPAHYRRITVRYINLQRERARACHTVHD